MKRRTAIHFCTALALFLVLGFCLLWLTDVAAAPLVTSGAAPWVREMIGVRWKSLANTGSEEMYLGITGGAGGGLGNALNRTGRNMTWRPTNLVTYTFDRAADIMTGTMSNSAGNWLQTYPNVAAQLTARGVTTKTVNDLNLMQLTVVNRDYPAAGVVFQDVYLDGYPLGSFGNVSGWSYWTVSRHVLNQGFVVTGTVVLTGTFSGDEVCKVEVSSGNASLGNIGGVVWFDQDTNGSHDVGEPGVAGIGVNLGNPLGNDTDTTDGAGAYSFPNLFLDQTYTTTLDSTTLPPSTSYSTASQYVDALTTAYTEALHNDFGLYGTGAIGNWVWYDQNGGGVQDPGELGMGGVGVTLTNASGLEVATTTDANGYYTFTNLLLDDTYTVTVSAAGYYATTANPQSATLTSRAPTNYDLDFGLNTEYLQALKFRPHDICCVGWNFWWYIVITNTSGGTLHNIVVTDTLPPEVAPYSVSTGIGPPFTGVPGGSFDGVNTVVWTFASIGPGNSQWMSIKARLYSWAVGLPVTNHAWVMADELGTPIPLTDSFEACECPEPPTPTPTPAVTPTPGTIPGTLPGSVNLVIQEGTFGDSEDTYIYRWVPDFSGSTSPLLKVGYKQTNLTLLRFDLSFIPPTAVIDSALLELYAAGWSGADMALGVYGITHTVTISEATWVDGAAGNPWNVPGVGDPLNDRRPEPEDTLTTAGILRWYWFDVTALVNDWVHGMPNNGFLVRNGYGTVSFFFASNENSDVTKHPMLSLSYHIP